MLTKTNRLAKDQDIKKVFARGRGFFNPNYGLKFLAKGSVSRLTIVVSTKVFKRAVKRNRLKRILREYFRKNLKRMRPGDYVLSAKPALAKISEKLQMEGLERLMVKSKLLES